MSLGVELHKWKVQSNSDSPNRIHVGRFRDAEFEQKMAEVLCVYREVQVLNRAAAKSRKAIQRVAIVSYDETPGIQAIAPQHPICRPSPASTRPWRGITSTNVTSI
jgi:hypothetical protein